jgi:hypothetical protein
LTTYLSLFIPSAIKRDDVSKNTIRDEVYATESYYDDYPDMAMGSNYYEPYNGQ